MAYDVVFVTGEIFFDHPLCGVAILKRLLESHGYSVGVIEMPQKEGDVAKLGKPTLFFGITSGAIDSMVRNYTPLKKRRSDDTKLGYMESVPDRAVIVYSNWVRRLFKDTQIVIGGTEASLRRFAHYDYWDNKLRKPILLDSRADILAYGMAEKQVVEIASRIRAGRSLSGIAGTCVLSRQKPDGFAELPSFIEVCGSKDRFCDMQQMFTNNANLSQKIDARYVLQYAAPIYTPGDLDSYYEMPFSRVMPIKHLFGFEFSVVTHRGCIGGCNFCSLSLLAGDRIISRSEESILREIIGITKLRHFKGNIDDLGGPSANMYGMDCRSCNASCIQCEKLDRSNERLINLLKKARAVKGVRNVYVKSGIRYDLASDEYLKEVARDHIFDTLRVAPEHTNKDVLRLMNKDMGSLRNFVRRFHANKSGKQLSFYFMVAHPGCGMNEARALRRMVRKLKNTESIQVFTPTPMTVSTCMYYTGMDPRTKEKLYVPYTYSEKKEQKRILFQAKS